MTKMPLIAPRIAIRKALVPDADLEAQDKPAARHEYLAAQAGDLPPTAARCRPICIERRDPFFNPSA